MGVNIKFEGLGDLIDTVELYAAAPEKIENDALREAAQPIVDEAKASTAFHDYGSNDREAGKLRDSISESGIKTERAGRKYILAGTGVRYAHLVEYGHGGPHPAPAHPFLEPAYNHHKDEAAEIIAARLREAL